MSNAWRLINSGYLSGSMNMALDEALFESVASGASSPVFRVYRWKPATVSLGYGQRLDGAVDSAACRRLGLDVVRRATGGRAVLHDREVTYSVIAPDGGVFPGGILDNYRVIAEVLREAICFFGVRAELVPGRSTADRSAASARSVCFTAPSSYELVVNGCKVAGSAQKRSGGVFLQHGSIPLEMDLSQLFAVLEPSAQLTVEEGARRLARSVGWLNRFAPRTLEVSEVEERLVECFAQRVGCELTSSEPTAAEWQRAEELTTLRFSSLV